VSDDEPTPSQLVEKGGWLPRAMGGTWNNAQANSATVTGYDVRFSAEEVHLLLRTLEHCLATCAKKAVRGQQAPCEHCDRTQILRQRLARLVRPSDSR
jgi:N-methylhydantoinase B/oxoprolinase/acetone carboxylase alpha subunit